MFFDWPPAGDTDDTEFKEFTLIPQMGASTMPSKKTAAGKKSAKQPAAQAARRGPAASSAKKASAKASSGVKKTAKAK